MREKSTKIVKKTKNRGIYMQILRNQRRDRVSKLEKTAKSGLLTNESAGNIMATTSETKTIKNNRTGKRTEKCKGVFQDTPLFFCLFAGLFGGGK